MPRRTSQTGSERFVVDNSDREWKVQNEKYLHDWCQLSRPIDAIDLPIGYFESAGLLALDGEWEKVDAIRILMGDEVRLSLPARRDLRHSRPLLQRSPSSQNLRSGGRRLGPRKKKGAPHGGATRSLPKQRGLARTKVPYCDRRGNRRSDTLSITIPRFPRLSRTS